SRSLEILDIQYFKEKEEALKFDKLCNLKVLRLNTYCKIGKIKGGTIGTMKGLQELDLHGISCDYDSFRRALADIEELSLLQIFDVQGDYLKDFLEGIKLPKSLKKLYTSSGFANVEELLELENFTIEGSKATTELAIPPAASSRGGDTSSTIIPWINSSKLKSMKLEHMKRIIMIDSKHTLLSSSPTNLTIFHVDSERIPNLKNLRNLTEFKIEECHNLEEVQGMGGLKSLQVLLIVGERKLTRIHSLGNLMSCSSCKLTELYISNCPLLCEVVTFEQQDDDDDDDGSEYSGSQQQHQRLEGLVYLSIYNADSKRILNLKNLGDLTKLELRECPNLQMVQGMEGLISLQVLIIEGAEKLTHIHGLGNLMCSSNCKLTELVISKCPLLCEVVAFEQDDDDDGSEGERERDLLVQIESLVKMEILDSASIDCRSIPRLSKFPIDKKLKIKNIGLNNDVDSGSQQGQHQLLEGLENLQELVKLSISNVDLKLILNLKNLGNLTKLELRECPNLEEVQGIEGLKSLQVLFIQGAEKLTHIHGLGNLMCSSSCKLTELVISKCPLLHEVEIFEQLDDGGSYGRDFFLHVEILEIPSIDGSNIWSKLPMIKNKRISALRKMTLKGTENPEDLSEPKLTRYRYTEAYDVVKLQTVELEEFNRMRSTREILTAAISDRTATNYRITEFLSEEAKLPRMPDTTMEEHNPTSLSFVVHSVVIQIFKHGPHLTINGNNFSSPLGSKYKLSEL
ncbi:Disease resistance protein L6, partial [Linum perenne]